MQATFRYPPSFEVTVTETEVVCVFSEYELSKVYLNGDQFTVTMIANFWERR